MNVNFNMFKTEIYKNKKKNPPQKIHTHLPIYQIFKACYANTTIYCLWPYGAFIVSGGMGGGQWPSTFQSEGMHGPSTFLTIPF